MGNAYRKYKKEISNWYYNVHISLRHPVTIVYCNSILAIYWKINLTEKMQWIAIASISRYWLKFGKYLYQMILAAVLFLLLFLWSKNDRIIILIENRIFSFVGTRSFQNFFDITSFVWSWESERLKLVALFKLRAVGEIWIDKVVSVANLLFWK